jgi:hypothetical protein
VVAHRLIINTGGRMCGWGWKSFNIF